jgi:predicted Rossmann fold flavoprotein
MVCQSLIIATGALSIPTLGGSGFGYDVAEQFSMEMVDRRAGLVPFMFSDQIKPVCARLAGISLEVEVSCNNQTFRESLLFTHRGISGPVILQISSYWHPGDELTIDLLPELNGSDWLISEKQRYGSSRLKPLLSQKLPNALVQELQTLLWIDLMDKSLAEISDKQLASIGRNLNCWVLKPSATEGYRTAEVTLGGVSTDNLDAKTMQAKHQLGLFFIGEVVDVSGHLGGFNFQWAWSSGFCAGMTV